MGDGEGEYVLVQVRGRSAYILAATPRHSVLVLLLAARGTIGLWRPQHHTPSPEGPGNETMSDA